MEGSIGIIKLKGTRSVAQKMHRHAPNVRSAFDYFRMTKNSCGPVAAN
jgi:hypothetical protein